MKLKVVAASENTNSFGLREMIFFSEDYKAYRALANEINFMPEGTVIETHNDVEQALVKRNLECVSRLAPDPPQKLVEST